MTVGFSVVAAGQHAATQEPGLLHARPLPAGQDGGAPPAQRARLSLLFLLGPTTRRRNDGGASPPLETNCFNRSSVLNFIVRLAVFILQTLKFCFVIYEFVFFSFLKEHVPWISGAKIQRLVKTVEIFLDF